MPVHKLRRIHHPEYQCLKKRLLEEYPELQSDIYVTEDVPELIAVRETSELTLTCEWYVNSLSNLMHA